MDVTLGRYTHALLRIAAGLLLLQHGLQKVFGLLGGVNGLGASAPIASQLGLAGVLEVGGGALLIAGLFTRPVAAALMVEMIVAYAISHAPQGGWPVQNDGELALAYAVVFAFLSANGSGTFSLDTLLTSTWRLERRRPSRDRRHPLPDTALHYAGSSRQLIQQPVRTL